MVLDDILQKDEKNSSPCWIAFVQRYNFPYQVLKRGEAVEKASEGGPVSKFHQSKDVKSIDVDINLDLDQLVTVGRPTGSEDASAIDFSTVMHVQCCGHQVLMVFYSCRSFAILLMKSVWFALTLMMA